MNGHLLQTNHSASFFVILRNEESSAPRMFCMQIEEDSSFLRMTRGAIFVTGPKYNVESERLQIPQP